VGVEVVHVHVLFRIPSALSTAAAAAAAGGGRRGHCRALAAAAHHSGGAAARGSAGIGWFFEAGELGKSREGSEEGRSSLSCLFRNSAQMVPNQIISPKLLEHLPC
jgi:hypothetical protein